MSYAPRGSWSFSPLEPPRGSPAPQGRGFRCVWERASYPCPACGRYLKGQDASGVTLDASWPFTVSEVV